MYGAGWECNFCQSLKKKNKLILFGEEEFAQILRIRPGPLATSSQMEMGKPRTEAVAG